MTSPLPPSLKIGNPNNATHKTQHGNMVLWIQAEELQQPTDGVATLQKTHAKQNVPVMLLQNALFSRCMPYSVVLFPNIYFVCMWNGLYI